MLKWRGGRTKLYVLGLMALANVASAGNAERPLLAPSIAAVVQAEGKSSAPTTGTETRKRAGRFRGSFKGVARPQRGQKLPSDLELTRDIVYGEGGGHPLVLDILRRTDRTTTSPAPAIVYIHGGGWRGGSKDRLPPLLKRLAQSGYFCVSIEYRLTREAPFPAQIEDCKCAIRWLRANADKYHLNDKIGVWGTSAGGHLAALLGVSGGVASLEGKGGWSGYSSRVQAVVNSFGPTDLLLAKDTYDEWAANGRHPTGHGLQSVALLLGGDIANRRAEALAASPSTYVSADDPPFLLIHGAKDTLVPVSQCETFNVALKKAGVPSESKILPEFGHGATSPESERMAAEFFAKYLGKP